LGIETVAAKNAKSANVDELAKNGFIDSVSKE